MENVSLAQTITDDVGGYEVVWTVDGVTIRTLYSTEGVVLERNATRSQNREAIEEKDEEDDDPAAEEEQFERRISIDLVPDPAKSTIINEAGTHKIAEVEMVIVDAVLLYEADWHSDGEEIGIRVAPDGKILAREEEKLEEDDSAD